MQTSPRDSLSVVIPMYNEVDNVEPLLQEIIAALAELRSYEIVVVDDGSNDGTQALLRQLQQTLPQLKVCFHQGNFGQSAALVSGARVATHDWLVTMDGDGQNNPQDILQLINAYEQQQHDCWPVLVAGNRQNRQDTWLRRCSSRIANRIRCALLKDDCPDTGCSLKLFPRQTFLQMPHFNHLHRFMPALFKRANARVINVPVSHRPRLRGQSKYGLSNRLWVGLVDLFGVMWLIRRPCNPEVTDDRTSSC